MTELPQEADLPIFVEWTAFLDWLLDHTAKIPKSARFTRVGPSDR